MLTESSPCPCCGNPFLLETGESYALHDILHVWERHGVVFSESTRTAYSENCALILYRCPQCAFGVFLPMIVGTDSFYADITKAEYYLPDRWDFHVALNAFPGQRDISVLDIGCGQGSFLKLVRSRFPHAKVAGNDANPEAFKALSSDVTFYSSFAEIPSNAYGVVTLFQVVEHVADPLFLLREAVRSLKPGGALVASVPDYTGPVRYFTHSHTATPPHHVSQWTQKSLDTIVAGLGLEIAQKRVEPLPDYLFDGYLPTIIKRALPFDDSSKWAGRAHRYLTMPLLRALHVLNVKSLPIHGHTYCIVAKKIAG